MRVLLWLAVVVLAVGLFWMTKGQLQRNARPSTRPSSTSAWKGEPPVTIALDPMTGEDFIPPVLLKSPATDVSRFLREGLPLDADTWLRGLPYQASGSTAELAVAAAVLERAAKDGDADCPVDSGFPAWPPTWRVRVIAADGSTVRDFPVSARLVRCRARGESANSGVLEALQSLGASRWAPTSGAAPRLVAPEVARAGLLALARGPDGQPRTAALTVSLADGRGVLVHVGAPVRKRRDMVTIKDASLRALLETALEHPAVVAGMQRSARTYPARVAHGEFRVLEHFEGFQRDIVVFAAYLPKEDAEALAQELARTLDGREPSAARILRRQDFRAR